MSQLSRRVAEELIGHFPELGKDPQNNLLESTVRISGRHADIVAVLDDLVFSMKFNNRELQLAAVIRAYELRRDLA